MGSAVDAVYHAAADVNWVAPYGALRAADVARPSRSCTRRAAAALRGAGARWRWSRKRVSTLGHSTRPCWSATSTSTWRRAFFRLRDATTGRRPALRRRRTSRSNPPRAAAAATIRGRLVGREESEAPRAGIRAQHRRQAHLLAPPWPHRVVTLPSGPCWPGRRTDARCRDKIKLADRELIEVAEAVADICAGRLGRTLRRHRDGIGLRGAHLRELALLRRTGRTPAPPHPACYGTWQDESRQEWGLVLERLGEGDLTDATEAPAVWTRACVHAALDGLAQIQAVWSGREAHLASRPWIGHVARPRAWSP